MSRLLVAGVSYKNGALPQREALAALSHDRVIEALKEQGVKEAVVLSTCNRFELYLVDDRDDYWVAGMLEKLAGTDLKESLYFRRDGAAIDHLFAVSAGLDSLVVGESEILGQVKLAYESAKASGTTDKRTNVLFQRALYTGKKVRNDTAIAVGPTSVATVAVQLAEAIFGPLKKSEVLILGAGAMAELTARHLLSKKVAKLTIANRTWERGKALADGLGAAAVPWDKFEAELPHVDIVVASTGADKAVLKREAVEAAMARRAGRSLFIIDIAMPRDVEETVQGLEHVYLYRLEDLETIVAKNMADRGGEVAKAKRLAETKAAELWKWFESLAAGKEISLKHSDAETETADV